MTTAREGSVTVLKCRTPREAILVAYELEARNILVIFPDEETMSKEYQEEGFVSIRVSTRSYEAATELRTVIERDHWEERARQPLSIPMIFVAIALGMIPFPGLLIFFSPLDSLKMKSYRRKAKSFRRWFLVGLALFFVLLMIFSVWASGT